MTQHEYEHMRHCHGELSLPEYRLLSAADQIVVAKCSRSVLRMRRVQKILSGEPVNEFGSWFERKTQLYRSGQFGETRLS